MITRAAKHILRALLRGTPDNALASVIAHFLNCLLGTVQPSSGLFRSVSSCLVHTASQPTGKKKKKEKRPAAFDLTSQSLWDQVIKEVKERFQYDLPQSRNDIRNIVVAMPTLRSVCQKVGIQVTFSGIP